MTANLMLQKEIKDLNSIKDTLEKRVGKKRTLLKVKLKYKIFHSRAAD